MSRDTPKDNWSPGVRVVVRGRPGQIVRRCDYDPTRVWVKFDDALGFISVLKRDLRGEGSV